MASSDLYVMFNPFTGLVKIGISEDVEARRDSLEHACGVALDVLAVFDGQARHEQRLHLAFAHVRQRGEWFLPTPEIIDLVEGRETPDSLLVRMSATIAENQLAVAQAVDAKRERQQEERAREKQRLEAVRREEARIKQEEADKRAKAKAERERKAAERAERQRQEWQNSEAVRLAQQSLYKTEAPDRFAALAQERATLVRTSQRARNCATLGVKVTVE